MGHALIQTRGDCDFDAPVLVDAVVDRNANGEKVGEKASDERYHSGQCFMTLDRKRCLRELRDYGGRGEPQLAVDALVEVPAVQVANPDEIVNLHTSGLILEEAGHDQVIGAAER